MSKVSRRKLIVTGVAVAAGAAGVGVAAKLAKHYGLVPPDAGGLYGAGETLTYAAQRLLTRHSMAREFTRNQISESPFANEVAPLGEGFQRLQEGGFADWRLTVDGMVAHPMSFSVAEIKSFPSRTQITHLACEEGWSYIAEWRACPSLTSSTWSELCRRLDTSFIVRFNRTGGKASTWPMRCIRKLWSRTA